jgi:hypothetical protein
MGRRKIYPQGTRFGYLVVVEPGPIVVSGKVLTKARTYLCDCDCGNLTTVRVAGLTNGTTTSCGCYAKWLLKQRRKAYLEAKRNLLLSFSTGDTITAQIEEPAE